jgi:hypothetical protein
MVLIGILLALYLLLVMLPRDQGRLTPEPPRRSRVDAGTPDGAAPQHRAPPARRPAP